MPAGTPDTPQIAIVMGSRSDWPTMTHAADVLSQLGVAHDCRVVSAHRTPDRLAHLPGMIAAMTPLPVLGVPVESAVMKGQDSLLSIVQMPGGVPVGTLAIGKAGAKNGGLLAASILALGDPGVAERLDAWRQAQTDSVPHSVED